MRLPLLLGEYFSWRRRFDNWIAVTTISLDAARRLGDRRREGDALTILGLALVEVRRFEEAITAHQDAAAIDRETGDRHGEGLALEGLGLALIRKWVSHRAGGSSRRSAAEPGGCEAPGQAAGSRVTL